MTIAGHKHKVLKLSKRVFMVFVSNSKKRPFSRYAVSWPLIRRSERAETPFRNNPSLLWNNPALLRNNLGLLKKGVIACAQGFRKKTEKTSFTQFVVLIAPMLQGLYCLLVKASWLCRTCSRSTEFKQAWLCSRLIAAFPDIQPNPHNWPKAYELLKAKNPDLSSTPVWKTKQCTWLAWEHLKLLKLFKLLKP